MVDPAEWSDTELTGRTKYTKDSKGRLWQNEEVTFDDGTSGMVAFLACHPTNCRNGKHICRNRTA